MTDRLQRKGAMAVLEAASATTATFVFFPGVLARIGFQNLTARLCGARITHSGFVRSMGGDVVAVSDRVPWTALFVVTFLGPVFLGSWLLLPTLIDASLLDVRPFASISSDPQTFVSTDVLPWLTLEMLSRFEAIDLLRLWFAISCFYCSIPSQALVEGTSNERHTKSVFTQVAVVPLLACIRLLRTFDDLLTVVCASSYLASGLIVLVVGWRLLASIIRTLFM